MILAESGNLLMIGSRAKDSVWMKTSLAMVEAGAAALKAAEAKDVDGITEAGNQIIDAAKCATRRTGFAKVGLPKRFPDWRSGGSTRSRSKESKR